MCLSIVSALTRLPVNRNVAMTGEITLRGRILPIGGLKEKILAAHRGGIKQVLIPAENKKDIREIPQSVLKQVKVTPVEHMDEVVRHAILVKEGESPYTEQYQHLMAEPTGSGDSAPLPAGMKH